MVILLIVFLIAIVALAAGFVFWKKINGLKDSGDLAHSIDKEVAKLYRDNGAQAVVVGVIKNDKLWVKGSGAGVKPPDGNTLFQIGSLTKVFTGALLQSMVNKGELDLDATLSSLIGDKVKLSDKVSGITLRQLITHTSGLPRIPKPLYKKLISIVGKKNIMVDPYNHLFAEDIYAYLSNPVDAKAPGKFAYSNYGVGLIGHIMELRTGLSYEALLKRDLFEPLGMSDTTVTLPTESKERLATGFDAKGNPAGVWTSKILAGAGALYSSANDILNFLSESLQNDSLASSLFQAMHEPQFEGMTGIAWMQPTRIEKFFGNNNFVWHNGMVGGYASYMAISAKDKQGIVVLSSRAIDTTMLGVMTVRQVRTQSWSTSTPTND